MIATASRGCAAPAMSAKQRATTLDAGAEGQEGAAGVLSRVDSNPSTHDQLPHPNLYVKGLPSSHLDPDSVWQLFHCCGDVESVRVVKYERARSTRAFAFVRMKDTAAAAAALGLDGSHFQGAVLSVSLADADSQDRPATRGQELTPCHTVYIKHVPVHYGPQELSQLFAPFGPVVHVRLLQDIGSCSYSTRTAAALVQLGTVEAATAAVLALHDNQLPGVPAPLVARFADPARTRQPHTPSSDGRSCSGAGAALGSVSSAGSAPSCSSLASAVHERRDSGAAGVTTSTQVTTSGDSALACESCSSPGGCCAAAAGEAAGSLPLPRSPPAGKGIRWDARPRGAQRGSRRPGLCPQQEVADAQPVRGGQSGSSKGQRAGYAPGVTRHHPLRPLLPRSPDEGPRASFARLSSQSSHHQQPQYVQQWPHPQREQQHGHWDQEQQQEAGHRVALQEVEWEEHWPHAGQGQGAAGARPPATWAPATSRGLVCAPPPPPPPLPAAAYLVPRFMPPGVPLPAPQMHYWVPVAAPYPTNGAAACVDGPQQLQVGPRWNAAPVLPPASLPESTPNSSSSPDHHRSCRSGSATAVSGAGRGACSDQRQRVFLHQNGCQHPLAAEQAQKQDWPLPLLPAAVSAGAQHAAGDMEVQDHLAGEALGMAQVAAAPLLSSSLVGTGESRPVGGSEGRAVLRPAASNGGVCRADKDSRGATRSSCSSCTPTPCHPPPSEDQAIAAGVRGAAGDVEPALTQLQLTPPAAAACMAETLSPAAAACMAETLSPAVPAAGAPLDAEQPGSVPQAQEAPNLEEEGQLGDAGTAVEVHNLPEYATSLLLYQTFGPLGAILAAHVRTNLYGTCTGTGYVTFRSPHDAAQAVSRSGQLAGPGTRPLHVVPSSKVSQNPGGPAHA